MENQHTLELKNKSNHFDMRRNKNSQIYTGAFILIIGLGVLLSKIGAPIPYYLLSWKVFLIALGLFIGFRSGFKEINWIIPIVIGSVFLIGDIFPGFSFGRIAWPTAIIVVGAVILFKGLKVNAIGKNNGFNDSIDTGGITGFKRMDETDSGESGASSSAKSEPMSGGDRITNDMISLTAVFGGVKRTVVSKNFLGGEITSIFGGAEVDLTHADIRGVVKIDATNILGGTKLLVPSNWDVQSEMVAIFGGVEDKRRIQPDLIDRSKRLILTGTCLLGGLEIKTY